MQIFDTLATSQVLPFDKLINQIETLFANSVTGPDRHHHTMPMRDEADATLLLMPAWNDAIGCVKTVTVTPGNTSRNLPSLDGSVLVFDRTTGLHLALLDGAVLTARRTASASALAAKYLSRKDSKHLLLIGSGKVAAQLTDAFSAVRPIETVRIWDRNPEHAQRLVQKLTENGWDAARVENLECAVPQADIISAATLATDPIIKGEWLQAGQHVDLIGAFTPTMREADDTVMQRAQLYVDTEFAAVEAGELKIPLETGVITQSDILGDLYALSSGKVGRQNDQEITLFKSVGNAVMDLAAAITAIEQ